MSLVKFSEHSFHTYTHLQRILNLSKYLNIYIILKQDKTKGSTSSCMYLEVQKEA